MKLSSFPNFIIYIGVIPSDACLSLGGRPLAVVPKGSGKGQNRALVCGGQVEQEGRSRMVEVSLVLVGFWLSRVGFGWVSAQSVEYQLRLLESQAQFLAGAC